MSMMLVFTRKWSSWYRVLRYRNGFTFIDFVRYVAGTWLNRHRDDASHRRSDGKVWDRDNRRRCTHSS
jgi:hypothetical protein